MKTSELSELAIDWAVAKCEGVEVTYDRENDWYETTDPRYAEPNDPHIYSPTIYWAQCGEIIERQKIDVMWCYDRWCAYAMTPDGSTQIQTEGDTPLIAAMHAYVASQLGGEIGVPKELTNENQV